MRLPKLFWETISLCEGRFLMVDPPPRSPYRYSSTVTTSIVHAPPPGGFNPLLSFSLRHPHHPELNTPSPLNPTPTRCVQPPICSPLHPMLASISKPQLGTIEANPRRSFERHSRDVSRLYLLKIFCLYIIYLYKLFNCSICFARCWLGESLRKKKETNVPNIMAG